MPTTFNRFEQKYLIHKDQADAIKRDIMPFLKTDQHSLSPYYTIYNVYFDTVNDDIIKYSVSKPEFKQKLRLRCYSTETDQDIMYLELKKKLHGFVNKRRTHITLEDATMLIYQKVMPLKQDYHNTQVLNEIYYYIKDKVLYPRIAISYDREAYVAIHNPDFRVTFDDQITSRRDQVSAARDKDDINIINADLVIMELKTSTSIPLWMTSVLSKHKIFSSSFSKYGSAYYDFLIQSRKENDPCLNPYLTSPVPVSP